MKAVKVANYFASLKFSSDFLSFYQISPNLLLQNQNFSVLSMQKTVKSWFYGCKYSIFTAQKIIQKFIKHDL